MRPRFLPRCYSHIGYFIFHATGHTRREIFRRSSGPITDLMTDSTRMLAFLKTWPLVVLACVLAAHLPSPVVAQVQERFDWRSPDGEWSDAYNWNGKVPTFNGYAVIGNTGTARVQQRTSGGTAAIHVGSWGGTPSVLSIEGGALRTVHSYIGDLGSGLVTISGGRLESFVSLNLGVSDPGTLLVTGGTATVPSTVTAPIVRFGVNTNTVGSGTVSGGFLLAGMSAIGVSGTGKLVVTGGLVRSGTIAVAVESTSTGTLALSGGLIETSKVTSGSGQAAFVISSGTLRAMAASESFLTGFGSGVVLNSGTFVLDTNGYAVTNSSALTGSGRLAKVGAGSLTAATASTYTGGTFIEDGILVITDVGADESVLGEGAVTVKNGAKLAGVGTVLGDTTVAGTLAPGNSPGTMTFAGGLFLESTAVTQLEIASALSFDQIAVAGLLTYDGTLQISFLSGYFPGLGETFSLFEAGSVAPGSEFDTLTFSTDGYEGTLDYTTGKLTVTAVPEPATAGLVIMSLGVLMRRRIRR
jgi:autotransporter-associated beta strand protein